MKLKLLLMLLVFASFCSAQVDLYGVCGAGTLIQDGKTTFAFTMGGNVPIKTTEGFKTYNNTLMKYSDGFGESGEIQEIATFLMQEKTLGIWTSYLAIGTGAVVEIDDGQDDFDMAVKCELGAELFWKFGLAVGVEYLPISGKPNRTFVYGSVDLFR